MEGSLTEIKIWKTHCGEVVEAVHAGQEAEKRLLKSYAGWRAAPRNREESSKEGTFIGHLLGAELANGLGMSSKAVARKQELSLAELANRQENGLPWEV